MGNLQSAKKEEQQETKIQTVPPTPDSKKTILVTQLKRKYKQQYDAVQPIPYIRDRLYCVDRVFVEGGVDVQMGDKSWASLNSYHTVFCKRQIKSRKRIVIGEAGYGKSTLTLQYAYDWCNNIKQSYLKNVEILILLRLRQLGGVHSINTAIKRFLLPKESNLSESDIKSELENCSSVVFILDGFDEYPDEAIGDTSDVIRIIKSKLFKDCEVVLTTRYLPKFYEHTSKLLRLTGFDDKARDEYIRKAVVGSKADAATLIKRKLKENPVLNDLCEVPLFFVMFAHMSHENKELEAFNTVTSFFHYMIACFHGHMRNKMKDKNAKMYELFEKDHFELDKVAYEGLSKRQQIIWKKNELRHRLGKDFYDQYVRLGILVEEEDYLNDTDPPGNASLDLREVRFYHKLFCEWFAAFYLAERVEKLNSDQLVSLMKTMDPFDLQYCYRFACGLNNNAACKIIECLKRLNGGEKFAILCILEQGGKVDDVLDTVKALCSERIVFRGDDNKLLQRSIVQLLEIASGHEIFISLLVLDDRYCTVDLSSDNHLQLKSGLCIPVLTTLSKVTMLKEGKEVTSEEFTGFLNYASKCLMLKELVFCHCLLPQSAQAKVPSVLIRRKLEVIWHPSTTDYHLHLPSGFWECTDLDGELTGVMMTNDDYLSEVKKFRGKLGRKKL